MGYSAKKEAVEKVSQHLEQMLTTNEEIIWPTSDPDKLRYLLFQALSSAAINASLGEPYTSIALLRDKFKIRTEAGKVIASPRSITPLAAVRAQAQKRIVISDTEIDAPDIIAHINLYKFATELVFTGVSGTDLNLRGIYEVAQKYGFFVIPASTHLTFSKKPEDAELAWTPEEG